jgi:hypothetical protein
MHSREALINLLWSENPIQNASATLRVTLTRLRKEIDNLLHHYTVMLLMGEIHNVQGRLGQALIHSEKTAAISEESGDGRLLCGHPIYRIPVYLFGGALEQAEQVVNRLYTRKSK